MQKATDSVVKKKLSTTDEKVHKYRAEWSFERLASMIHPGDKVLNLGAGDCRLDKLLATTHGCKVTSLDVEDYNETDMPLVLYDGLNIPYPDNTFDVVLLIFSLHHAKEPSKVLEQAKRVCRRNVIAFEDLIEGPADRLIFRGFHRFLRWSQGFPLPNHEWRPEEWSKLANQVGLTEVSRKPLGRTFGYLASSHVGFVWLKT